MYNKLKQWFLENFFIEKPPAEKDDHRDLFKLNIKVNDLKEEVLEIERKKKNRYYYIDLNGLMIKRINIKKYKRQLKKLKRRYDV